MILELELSKDVKIPYAQYYINDDQTLSVIPVSALNAKALSVEGFETMHWGSLESLGFMMRMRTLNSLKEDNWDFETYPNPQIVVLSRLKS